MYDDSVIISVCFMILSSVNPLAISSNLTVAPTPRKKRSMASEQGVVIACHSKAEFDAHMTKAQEAGKLVRVPVPRLPRSPFP